METVYKVNKRLEVISDEEEKEFKKYDYSSNITNQAI